MSKEKQHLFSNFKTVSREEWVEKATRDLKGEDVFEKYSSELEQGVTIRPYYDASDLEKITTFQNRMLLKDNPAGVPRYWDNVQQIIVNDASAANQQALEALNSGADGVIFDLRNTKDAAVEVLLKDILIDYCHVSFIVSDDKFSKAYATYIEDRCSDFNGPKGVFIGTHYDTDFQNLINFPGIKTLVLRAQDLPMSEEIADLLLQATRHIGKISEAGLDAELALSRMVVIADIGTNYFEEMARLRAIRQLFFQLARAYQVDDYQPEDLYIHAISTVWTDERYQPHANMLKATTAAMSAILGGCDSLTVEPENPDSPLMTRIARNVSLVLRDESYLNKTADPVAGSYFIETLTDQLAEKAWTIFQTKVAEKEEVKNQQWDG